MGDASWDPSRTTERGLKRTKDHWTHLEDPPRTWFQQLIAMASIWGGSPFLHGLFMPYKWGLLYDYLLTCMILQAMEG